MKEDNTFSNEPAVAGLMPSMPIDKPKDEAICIHHLFERQVKERPLAIALVDENQELTYAELDRRSTILASQIQRMGILPEERVAICVNRSVDIVVAQFAVLKSGAAYVPIDIEYPDERIGYILSDSNSKVVITQNALSKRFRTIISSSQQELIFMEDFEDDNRGLNELILSNDVTPDNLAYVIYTSGSTGRPKGVMIEHRSMVHHLIQSDRLYRMRPDERVMLFSNFTFDVATEQIFLTLCHGHTLFIPTKETLITDKLRSYLLSNEITFTDVTPRFAEFALLPLVQDREFVQRSHLRTLVTGGESMSKGFCEKWLSSPIADQCRLLNFYGPTEITVTCTSYEVTGPILSQNVPIGKAFPGTEAYILKETLEKQDRGEVGELFISGVRVGRGYLGQPELTNERFLPDPFNRGNRMYKTGDMVRELPDGNIEFIGRSDFQVKIRGFRVELEEVENVISKYNGIDSTIVLSKEYQNINHLVAYYSAKTPIDNEALRDHVQGTLPDFMVPSAFVALDTLPLTTNGKVDRKALNDLEVNLKENVEYVSPNTPTELIITTIWEEVFNRTPIGVNQNFFALGGHSLIAGKIISRINKRMKIDISPARLLSNPQIDQLAAVIDQLSSISHVVEIENSKRPERLPLSFAQERMWFLSKLGYSTQYHIPELLEIVGELKSKHLHEAINYVVRRHETLRTTFVERDDRPSIEIANKLLIDLEYEDLSDSEYDLTEVVSGNRIRDFIERPFSLEKGPLIRFIVIKVRRNKYILGLCVHHIISDGWSTGVLLEEISNTYNQLVNGQQPNSPHLQVQYVDYSLWQRQVFSETKLAQESAYWRNKLAGHTDLNMPTDHSRPAQLSGNGGHVKILIDRQKVAQINSYCQESQVTLYTALISSVYILLQKYSGENDICLGMPVAGRNHQDIEDLIGFFVNTLVIRVGENSENLNSPKILMSIVNKTILEAQEYQNIPFEKLVEDLKPTRDLSRNPFFQMVVNYNPDHINKVKFQGCQIDQLAFANNTAKFDMTFDFNERQNGDLELSLEYSTDLYTEATATALSTNLIKILEQITSDNIHSVSDIDLLDEQEKVKLLKSIQHSNVDYSHSPCIHNLFQQQVNKTPEAIAVVDENGRLTYAQLDEKSNRLALYLQNEGIKANSLVGVFIDRSVELVVILMGILKAGGAYVPIDPEYPEERVRYIIEDSQLQFLITEKKLEKNVAGFSSLQKFDIVSIEGVWKENTPVNRELLAQVTPDNLAYVIYTSGSTGKPKGVLVKHGNVTSLLESTQQKFHFNGQDVWTFFHSYCFDFSVWEIFGCLSFGGKLVTISYLESRTPALFLQSLEANGVTVLNQTPSAFYQLLDEIRENGVLPDLKLRYVIFGGEAINPPRLKSWYDLYPDHTPKLINMYGITETTVHVSYFELSKENVLSSKSIIGKSIDSLSMYILDQNKSLLPKGVPGEIYVAGFGVSKGYLGKEELTNERFIDNPFQKGTKLYKTGDLARYLPDGNIEYLRRIDNQIQLRGFRIELGEIETVLAAHESVKDVTLLVKKVSDIEQLVACFTSYNEPPTQDDLRAFASQNLPGYMVPNAFVWLSSMPINANGKVDRKTLMSMDFELIGSREYQAPTTNSEKELAKIWQEVLEVQRVGINDNFFDLGGHSLLATQIVSRVNRKLNVHLSLKNIFEFPRLTDFAQLLEKSKAQSYKALTEVRRGDILPLSFSQERLWFLDEYGHGSRYHIPLSLRINGNVNKSSLQGAINYLFVRHESLRTNVIRENNEVFQRISNERTLPVEFVTLEKETGVDYKAIINSFIQRPFNLSCDVLIRVQLIETEKEHLLTFCMHHIISDGWSMQVLLKELNKVYNAIENERAPSLEPLKIQFPEYSIWQRETITEASISPDLQFWKYTLSGCQDLDMPTDHIRPAELSGRGQYIQFPLETDTSQLIKDFCQKRRITPFSLLMTAVYVLLYRYSSQKDICLGMPVANRNDRDLEDIIGFFVNTLVIRIDGEEEEQISTEELLKKVHQTILLAQEHQELPFEKLVEHLNPNRDLSRSPFFQVLVTYDYLKQQDLSLGDLEVKIEPIDYNISKFDLAFNFSELIDTEMMVNVEFSSDLYNLSTIERMVNHLKLIIHDMVAEPVRLIDDIEILKGQERETILDIWNVQKDVPEVKKCIHELFADKVKETPEAQALIFKNQQFTYAELNYYSDNVARRLSLHDIKPDDFVGVCFDRSAEMVIAILAVLKAGAAYVPIDPEYPDDRIVFMLKDSEVKILLSLKSLETKLSELLPDQKSIIVTIDDYHEEIPESGNQLTFEVKPNNLAYMIYTSGSTGNPKGVMIEHKAYISMALDQMKRYGVYTNYRCLQFASICFDASVHEIFITLLGGGTLIVADSDVRSDKEAFIEFLINKEVNWAVLPPSLLKAIGKEERLKLDTLATAGEPAEYSDVVYHSQRMRYFNAYGPTEASVCSSIYKVNPDNIPSKIPIGKPLDNTQLYILDSQVRPVPIGVPGELYIGGAGLARGYWKLEKLTREKFISSPFGKNATIYRTGDLVKWLPDGNIEYIGRIDNQVKVRGFRIELGEIENALLAHSKVDSVAVVKKVFNNSAYLVAYYTSGNNQEIADLRSYLSRRLPDYMIPNYYVVIPNLPLTPNGKIDRKKLSALHIELKSDAEYVAPENDVERKLATIWEEILKVEQVGVYDNFFEIGGHSLLATQIISRINQDMSANITLSVLFKALNIRTLAEKVLEAEEVVTEDIINDFGEGGEEFII